MMEPSTPADDPEFTELEAADLYVRMVNDLDAEPFIAKLAPLTHYVSHFVMAELDDRDAIAKLLRGKVQNMQGKPLEMTAGLGVAGTFDYPRPLVFLFKGEAPKATVGFQVADGMITHIAITIPGLHDPMRLEVDQLPKFRVFWREWLAKKRDGS